MDRGAWRATDHGVPKSRTRCGSAGEESACSVGDLGSIPGLGRSPGEGKGYPLRYSGLENSMDCIVHGVAKCQTGGQATFTFTVDQGNLCFHYSLFANEIF